MSEALPVFQRCQACAGLEVASQMALIVEAAFGGDLSQRQVAVFQHVTDNSDTHFAQVADGRDAKFV